MWAPLQKGAMEPPVVWFLASSICTTQVWCLFPLVYRVILETGVEFETVTTCPRLSAPLEIAALLCAINYSFRVVSLLLHLTIGPFEKTLMWICKLPLWSFSHCSPPSCFEQWECYGWQSIHVAVEGPWTCVWLCPVYQTTPQFWFRV
jgi:hypothetical protein